MEILVTGGAGYVGSHACKALANAGYTPLVVDNLSRGNTHAVKWGSLYEGDLRDTAFLDKIFRDHDIQAVLHFAADSNVAESVVDPSKYYKNNVAGSINLVESALNNRCDKVIFSSTCQVYGTPNKLPIVEDDPKLPVNPYGHGKLLVERMLRDCDEAHGLRSVSLRYFNAAGADPQGDLGEEHHQESRLIPLVLRVAAGIREAVEVYGSDYPTQDGTAIRDYVHVTDLVDAHVAALKHLEAGGETTALNIGTGRGYSVKEVIDTARTVTGRTIRTNIAPRRPGDLPELVANCERAARVLDWQPSVVAIEDIVETAWRWQCRAQ